MGNTTLGRAPKIPLDRVTWRVDGQPTSDGKRARFVPYIDARDCAEMLDDWVGPTNWRNSFTSATLAGKEALFCHVEVRDPETGEWVSKTDVGVSTQFEAQKGMVSDAFKRSATVMWGVGRNVYDLPGDIWAPVDVYQQNGKPAARANKDSVPAILAELKKRGFDSFSTRAETEGTVRSDTDTTPQDRTPITDEQVVELKKMFESKLKNPALAQAKQDFAKQWGDPKVLPAAQWDAAVKAAIKVIVAHQPDTVEPPAASGESPVEDPPPATQPPDPPQVPPTSPPAGGEAAGLSVDDINAMSLRDINPHMAANGLPATGKVAAQRAALIEKLHGTAPAANVETGEKRYSQEQYIAGIVALEEDLEDPAAWFAWQFDHFDEKPMEEWSIEDLASAYEFIRNSVQGGPT